MGTQTTFVCSAGGSIARGRRRLSLLLSSMAGLMAVLAILVWLRGAVLPGLLAMAVAGAAVLAWRMSTDLELRQVLVGDEELEIRLRWGRVRVPLEGLSARRLSSAEVEHLEGLVSVGPFTASTGGFDSHRLGEFNLYASDLGQAVLLESPPVIDSAGNVAREPVRAVVTPDDPDEFLVLMDTRPPATIRSP